jgi:TDG/mug DNA glycosylase family protein
VTCPIDRKLLRVGFTRSQLESFHNGTLPDLLGPSTRLLFAGINPGLWTVATQSHFGRRGNRFYPALFRAGITDHMIDASAGFLADGNQRILATQSSGWHPIRVV